jgi:hypothetical protein
MAVCILSVQDANMGQDVQRRNASGVVVEARDSSPLTRGRVADAEVGAKERKALASKALASSPLAA